MLHWIKNHKAILLCAVSAAAVNLLMLAGLLENRQQSFFGITTGKGLLLAQIVLNLFLFLMCFVYGNFIRKKKRVCFTVAFTALTPIAGVCLMEGVTGNFETLTRAGLFLNIVIAGAILVLLLLFFQDIRAAAIVQIILLAVLSLVQYYVYLFRGRSFTLSDIWVLGTAADVASGYSYAMSFGTGAAVLLMLTWITVLLLSPGVKIRKYRILRKAAAVSTCIVVFFCLSDEEFVAKHNSLKLEMWNIDRNYKQKGVLLTLASQVQYLTVDSPEGYSTQKVEQTAQKYAKQYDERVNTADSELTDSGESDDFIPENLIVIMNESFADLRNFGVYEDQLAVTPCIDAITDHVRKGWLNVPVMGGGTSNTEYEVLTGNCMAFWDNWTMAYQVYGQETEYGMASTLKAQGYRTIAMHPHRALNYNRSAVYRSMGFDEFLSKENWDEAYKEKIRKFVSDQSCYDYVKELCRQKEDGEKLFTFLVTMQNHSPYRKKYQSTVELELSQDYPETEQYLSLIKESDAAFGDLVDYFRGVDEPTMIVMFGDHLPNIQDGFYDALAAQCGSDPMKYQRGLFMTPYILWTNYENKIEEIPVMNANFFGSYVMEAAGVSLTDYNKSILEILKHITVINENEIMDSQGNWYSADALSEELKEMLNDYEILQYNEAFGRTRRKDQVFTLKVRDANPYEQGGR